MATAATQGRSHIAVGPPHRAALMISAAMMLAVAKKGAS